MLGLSLVSDLVVRLGVDLRALELSRNLVPVHKDAAVVGEEAVDVFEGAVRGLGVEEVGSRDEGGADDGPDNPELQSDEELARALQTLIIIDRGGRGVRGVRWCRGYGWRRGCRGEGVEKEKVGGEKWELTRYPRLAMPGGVICATM